MITSVDTDSYPSAKRIKMQEELLTPSELSTSVDIESKNSTEVVNMDEHCRDTVDFEINSPRSKKTFNFSKRKSKFKRGTERVKERRGKRRLEDLTKGLNCGGTNGTRDKKGRWMDRLMEFNRRRRLNQLRRVTTTVG